MELEFREDALEAIAIKAIERKSGARGLRAIIEGTLQEIMFELPEMNNLSKVVIDKGVIYGSTQPYFIYADKEKKENIN